MSFAISDAIQKVRDMDASLRWHDDRKFRTAVSFRWNDGIGLAKQEMR
jgi:hypothetical protein